MYELFKKPLLRGYSVDRCREAYSLDTDHESLGRFNERSAVHYEAFVMERILPPCF